MTEGGRTHDAFDVDPDDKSLFYANPDVEGPGGPARYDMKFSVRDSAEVFEVYELEFESATLFRHDGGDVEVPVQVTVDVLESLDTTDHIVLTWGVEIPTGEYYGITFDTNPVEVVHEEDGDVTDQVDSETPEWEMDTRVVEDGHLFETRTRADVNHWPDSTWFEIPTGGGMTSSTGTPPPERDF